MKLNVYKPVKRANGLTIGPLQKSYRWSKVLGYTVLAVTALFIIWAGVVYMTGIQSGFITEKSLANNLLISASISTCLLILIYSGIVDRRPDFVRAAAFGVLGMFFMLGFLNVIYMVGFQSLKEAAIESGSIREIAQLQSLPHPFTIMLGSPSQINPYLAQASWIIVTVVLTALMVLGLVTFIEGWYSVIRDYHGVPGIVVTSPHESDLTYFIAFFQAFYTSASDSIRKDFDDSLFASGKEPNEWLYDHVARGLSTGDFRVALKDGLPVGFLLNSDHKFTIDLLIVHPLHQRSGAGKALMDDFKTRTLRKNNHRVNVFVKEANISATNFLKREGWLKTGQRGNDAVYSFEKSDLRNAVVWFQPQQTSCGIVPLMKIEKVSEPEKKIITRRKKGS